jgi:ATP-dependent RNA helicase HrpB
LQAPPGAGKTTRVPLALLDAGWLGERTIVMLEPRRLATRAAARRLAELLGQHVGESVGYRMRGDSRVGPRTRVEVVTEGVLTRRLQRDPTLEGVGLVIFDEFHERSLDADLGLALTLQTQALVRDDLRVLVMSATLDGAPVAELLGGAPIITSEGRIHPVDTRYVDPRAGVRIEAAVAAAVTAAVRDEPGDVLVFLPGASEIHRVAAQLAERAIGDAVVLPLYGAISQEAQDRALVPDPEGRRKIVLATSIAETSLTIEGVRIVVDSGLARVPRFSARTGMTRLETVRVSRGSADQRRGRAGRLGPGICLRLWPEHENSHLPANAPPEIANADLAPLALDLAAAGIADPGELRWLDLPGAAPFRQATELLRALNALDDRGHVTEHGREMHALPVHPRLAHMLIRARRLGAVRLACEVAALLEERDVLRGAGGPPDADVALRLDLLRRGGRSGSTLPGLDVDRDALHRVKTEADRLTRQMKPSPNEPQSSDAGPLLALAYPDRVAQRRPGDRARFVLRNGRGAELVGAQSLAAAPYIVAAELDDQRPESRVFLAAALSLDDVRHGFGDQIVTEEIVEFDDASSAVHARRRERLGAIVLRDVALAEPPADVVRNALAGAIRQRGIAALPWSDGGTRARHRIAFLAAHLPAWPDVSDSAMLERLEEWLGPSLDGVRRWNDLARIDFAAAIFRLLDWRQGRELDELAPTHLDVPSGSRIAIDYSDSASPVLAVRIQEVFGLSESPRLAGGRVAVTMHLLSPAQRPVQVTRDLAGFWRTSYFDVRKDLRGRYPKHDWPDDPLVATATRRVKRPPASG